MCVYIPAVLAHQDIQHTFANHPWLQEADGQAALRHVLAAFSVHNPTVGYCRSMNHIVALLLVALNRCFLVVSIVTVLHVAWCLVTSGQHKHCQLDANCSIVVHSSATNAGTRKLLFGCWQLLWSQSCSLTRTTTTLLAAR